MVAENRNCVQSRSLISFILQAVFFSFHSCLRSFPLKLFDFFSFSICGHSLHASKQSFLVHKIHTDVLHLPTFPTLFTFFPRKNPPANHHSHPHSHPAWHYFLFLPSPPFLDPSTPFLPNTDHPLCFKPFPSAFFCKYV